MWHGSMKWILYIKETAHVHICAGCYNEVLKSKCQVLSLYLCIFASSVLLSVRDPQNSNNSRTFQVIRLDLGCKVYKVNSLKNLQVSLIFSLLTRMKEFHAFVVFVQLKADHTEKRHLQSHCF